MTDNGPPFSSKEFAAFANQYRFGHITSSPRYPQSNGFIERMVQTVKQSMRKCAAAGHDPTFAMLVYRATPLTTSIPSPAELLNGRKYRALLPIRSPIQNPHCQLVREQMVKDKDKMCEHYNKTARHLPSLSQNQRVYVQLHPQCNQWTPATITQTPVASQPRSYSVETTNGAQLVRVSFKILSSRSFLQSRRLWVRRTHTMGFSPSLLGGSGGMLPRKIFEN